MAKKAVPVLSSKGVSPSSPPTDLHPPLAYAPDIVDQLAGTTDPFRRRSMIWQAAKDCSAMQRAIISVASDLASQLIYITPTVASPSSSDLRSAALAIDSINNAIRLHGWRAFVMQYVAALWCSTTGAVVALPMNASNVKRMTILPSASTRPHYGLDQNGIPLSFPNGRSMMGPPESVQGVWWVDGPSDQAKWCYYLNQGEYYQDVWDGVGDSAFIIGRPPAEALISDIVSYTILTDYLRRTINGTDIAQYLVWSNVNMKQLMDESNKLAAIQERKRQGLPVPIGEERGRVSITSDRPDRPADVKAVDLRAFPSGFDPIRMRAQLQEDIAFGLGIKASRVSSDSQKERFGNASQAAMLQGDEPGVRVVRASLERMLQHIFFHGLPFRIDMRSDTAPENYARISADREAAQVVASLGDVLTSEQKLAYLVSAGVIPPSTIGTPSIRSDEAETAGHKDLVRFTLPDFSTPITLSTIKAVERREMEAMKAGMKAADDRSQRCMLQAQARWMEFMSEEVPDNWQSYGMDMAGLKEDVDRIARWLSDDVVACALGGIRDARARRNFEADSTIKALRAGLLNRLASPSSRATGYSVPRTTLWRELEGLSRASSLEDYMSVIEKFGANTIARYYNAATSAVYEATFKDRDGGVRWVLGDARHCEDCVRFAGDYRSVRAMLSATGGRWPRDIRLKCSGHCKCSIEAL